MKGCGLRDKRLFFSKNINFSLRILRRSCNVGMLLVSIRVDGESVERYLEKMNLIALRCIISNASVLRLV